MSANGNRPIAKSDLNSPPAQPGAALPDTTAAANLKTGRLTFLKSVMLVAGGLTLLAGSAAALFTGLRKKRRKIITTRTGPQAHIGHRLRFNDKFYPKFTGRSTIKKHQVVIVGGGIAGLSAAWKLAQAGVEDFALFELESSVGGNSMGGQTGEIGYPTGAHYLPVPNPEAQSSRELLEEVGIISGYQNGLPIIKDEFVLQAPKYRMYQMGRWRSGDTPYVGATGKDIAQMERFERQMTLWKGKRGADGRRAFTIPIDYSSTDAQFRKLDNITFAQWLVESGFNSPYVNWYVNYACLDDYGVTTQDVSAYAGLHYMCSRHARRFEGQEDGEYIIRPEGNAFLAEALAQKAKKNIHTNRLIRRIEPGPQKVRITMENMRTGSAETVEAQWLINALPLFLARYLFTGDSGAKIGANYQVPASSAWLVANVFLKNASDSFVRNLAWDNLILHSDSLGYIVANHSGSRARWAEYILTYYLPLVPAEQGRRDLLAKDDAYWRDRIMADLLGVHPEIEAWVYKIELCRRAHAMAVPSPGQLWSGGRALNAKLQGRVIAAHSDLAGYSVFEEANYYGVRAAEKILKKLNKPFTSSLYPM